MPLNGDPWKWLCEDVGCHVGSWDKLDFESLALDLVANPVVLDVNVLHTTVVLWVSNDCDGRLIVHEHWRWFIDLDAQFLRIQTTSDPAAAAAMYSASVDDWATLACFLLDQLTAPVPILMQ